MKRKIKDDGDHPNLTLSQYKDCRVASTTSATSAKEPKGIAKATGAGNSFYIGGPLHPKRMM